jgi:hypothetical protein
MYTTKSAKTTAVAVILAASLTGTVAAAADYHVRSKQISGEGNGDPLALGAGSYGRHNSARVAWGVHRFAALRIQVRKRKSGATVTVYDLRHAVMSQRIFSSEEFEAVGGYSGLWIPEVQPLTNAFLIAKHGGYQGRTLLVLRDGRLLEFAGGPYYYEAASKRLFLHEETDVDELALTTVLNQNLDVICASIRPQDLRDAEGKPISTPNPFTGFICLPELAATRRGK